MPQLHSRLHLGAAGQACATELFDPRERRLDISNLDVERQVSLHAFGDVADPAADSDAFEVGLAVDEAVAERVVGIDCPFE